MIKALFRKQFSEVFSQFSRNRNGAQSTPKRGLIIFLAIFGVLYLSLGVSFFMMSKEMLKGLTETTFPLFYMLIGMIATAVGLLGSVFNAYSTIYEAKDTEMLLSLPIPPRNIVFVRVTTLYAMTLLYAGAVLLPAALAFLIYGHPTVLGGINAIFLFLPLTLLVEAVTLGIAFLVAAIARKVKNKKTVVMVFSVLITLLFYVIYFKAQNAVSYLTSLGEIPAAGSVILRPSDFPELLSHIGEDLIVTDGATLLGSDDKSGVAEIMNLFSYYTAHPDLPHRTICAAFTPDEEVGRGTENFDIERFGAHEAYTVDGGKLGEIEYECFNAASVTVEITGRSVHTGDAKNSMINAVLAGMEFNALLPVSDRPEHTEGYEGFYHLSTMEGGVDHALIKYIIRDHDSEKFAYRKEFMKKAAAFINDKYRELAATDIIKLTIRDQYYNMAIPMKDHMELVTRVKDAMGELGIEPIVLPIRGGTDGAALTYRGIPCPNLCTGGYNFHGRYEYASVQEIERSAELLILIARA